ncbi:MAG TPA: bacteriohopanetetrol glucosamine biosynthesis glycosyltransferase HpnI [Alphaproteobacteria bacterium]|nr:bacteriohopanetetrol glucosamine biosynthesis glycosyltransferase HpnI [Alphaproteobacteria bacterium]
MESTSPVAILTWFLAVLAAAGSVYQLLATFAVWRWRSKRDWRPTARPAVTLLKPLCGHETKLYDNLASFCRLDHPTVQIVFGVRDSKDAAIETVRRLQSDYPEADIELVIDQAIYGTNLKVSNLINMMAAARHDVLVLSDSDMSVAPDYLDHILGTLERPDTGLATCLYIGDPLPGVWSELGAAALNFWFLPSALVSKLLGGQVGCYGATIALRRSTLAAVGGFAAVKDQLADDYELGALVRQTGQRVRVARNVLKTTADEPSFLSLFRHELRWARTIRATEPIGYAGSVITHPVPLALSALAVGLTAGVHWTILAALAVTAVACRFVLIATVLAALEAPRLRWWLYLPRDILSLVVLVLAYCGRSVSWRRRAFTLDRAGSLVAEGETRL